MVETVRLYRGWMGLKPAPVVRVPRALAAPALAIGDLLGRLGWSSPIRTTAIKQMDHDVAGRDSGWAQTLGVHSRGFTDFLAQTPASVQDVWHARLWFVRPVAILTLGLFWLITGLISFGPGWNGALAILHEGGYGRLAGPVAWWGALLDVVLGLMLFVRPWTARVAIFMCLATVGYLIAGTISPAALLDRPAGAMAEGPADDGAVPVRRRHGRPPMSLYILLKIIHILSGAVLFGTGAGIAFFMLRAHATRDARTVADVGKIVVLADFVFTASAVVVQPISGAGADPPAGLVPDQSVAAGGLRPLCLRRRLLACRWCGSSTRMMKLGRTGGGAGRAVAARLSPAVPLVVRTGLAGVRGRPGHLLADGRKARVLIAYQTA